MNFLVIVLFISTFSVGYLARDLQIINPYFVLFPELLSGIAMLAVIGRVVSGRRFNLDARYFVFFSLLALTALTAIVVQNMSTGPIVAGLRTYFQCIPFFLLPAVYDFSKRQLNAQLGVMFGLMFAQVPLAYYQRFFQYAHRMHTGDVVTGTVLGSSPLSILMLCGIAVLVTFYLRRRLSLPMMLGLSGFLLVPTMLNETKGTLALLPIAMVAPTFFMPRGSRSFKKLLPVFATFVVAAIGFVSAYDHLIQYRRATLGNGETLADFVTEGHYERYLYRNAIEGSRDKIGRLDSVELALGRLTQDPLDLTFGLGIGNVSESQLEGFSGDYAAYQSLYQADLTQIGMFLWELGLAGVVLFLLFYFWVFRDARFLAQSDDSLSMLGQLWAVIIIMMVASLVYKSFLSMAPIAYPLWFFSGLVAARAQAIRRTQRAEQRSPARAPGSTWGVRATPVGTAAPGP